MSKRIRTTFLLAWLRYGDDDLPYASFEQSHVYRHNHDQVVTAGITRGINRVVVYCDGVHGEEEMTKDQLRQVAKCWLDGEYTTTEIDFRV